MGIHSNLTVHGQVPQLWPNKGRVPRAQSPVGEDLGLPVPQENPHRSPPSLTCRDIQCGWWRREMKGSDMPLGPVKQALSGKFHQELRSVRTLKEMCLHGVNFM